MKDAGPCCAQADGVTMCAPFGVEPLDGDLLDGTDLPPKRCQVYLCSLIIEHHFDRTFYELSDLVGAR